MSRRNKIAKRDLRGKPWFWLIIIAVYFGVAVLLSFLVHWGVGVGMVGGGIVGVIGGLIAVDVRNGT